MKQWEERRLSWEQEDVKEAFWRFVDQKWKDSLNAASADPTDPIGNEARLEARPLAFKTPPAESQRKPVKAKVMTTSAEVH